MLSGSASALDINTEVSLPDGQVGDAYEFEFEGEEGCLPYYFRFLTGHLPAGLEIGLDGKMTGTPTESGTFDFWVELDDSVTCASMPSQGEYKLIIAPRVVITALLHGAKLGSQVDTTVTAAGGGSLQWTVTHGSLPPGFTLNRDTGRLTGVASTPGSYPFTVQVRDDKRIATKAFTYVIAPPLSVGSGLSVTTEVGAPFSSAIGSSGGIGPIAWTPTGGPLPTGLTLDAATGTITGTPTAGGTFTIPITGTDVDGQTAQTTVSLSIARRLAITSGRLTARAGKRATARVARTGGVGPYTWRVSAGKLPRGVTLDRSTGALAGTPRKAGTYRFTASVTDKLGVRASRAQTLVVR